MQRSEHKNRFRNIGSSLKHQVEMMKFKLEALFFKKLYLPWNKTKIHSPTSPQLFHHHWCVGTTHNF